MVSIRHCSKFFTWIHWTVSIKYGIYPFRLHTEHVLMCRTLCATCQDESNQVLAFEAWALLKRGKHGDGTGSTCRFRSYVFVFVLSPDNLTSLIQMLGKSEGHHLTFLDPPVLDKEVPVLDGGYSGHCRGSPFPKLLMLTEAHPQAFCSEIREADMQKWKWCWIRYGQESGFQTTWGVWQSGQC